MLALSSILALVSQPLATRPDDAPLTPPSHVLDFSDIGELYSAALSPDGSRLYVLIHAKVIDLGRIVSFYWPEWMGALAGLISLVLLFFVIRRFRRPQRSGEPYCRRCNYNLSGQGADPRCPECGLDLAKRPPAKGRPAWKRAWPFAAAIALVLGAYGSMWACRVNRDVDWLRPDWISTRAVKWSEIQGLQWLKHGSQSGDVVVEVDAPTGTRRRTVCTRASFTFFHLVLTPRGDGFYLVRPDTNGIDLIATASGRTTAKFTADVSGPAGVSGFSYDIGGDAIIGHTKDGAAILSYWNESTATAHAVVWNPATGTTTNIASTPAYVNVTGGSKSCWGRQFLKMGDAEPVKVISTPLFMEAYPTNTYEVRWFGIDGRETRKVNLKATVSPHGHPAITHEGDLAIFSDMYQSYLVSFDLDTGTEAGRVATPGADGIEDPLLAPDGVRLFAPGRNAISIRDIHRKEWIGRLQFPKGFYAPRALSSPTASRVAGVLQGQGSGANVYSFAAAIWDVPVTLTEQKRDREGAK